MQFDEDAERLPLPQTLEDVVEVFRRHRTGSRPKVNLPPSIPRAGNNGKRCIHYRGVNGKARFLPVRGDSRRAGTARWKAGGP